MRSMKSSNSFGRHKTLKKSTTLKEFKKNSKENIDKYFDELTFDQAVAFLQERIKQSFEDIEEEERSKNQKIALLKKVDTEMKTLYKENNYLRDLNFGLKKK